MYLCAYKSFAVFLSTIYQPNSLRTSALHFTVCLDVGHVRSEKSQNPFIPGIPLLLLVILSLVSDTIGDVGFCAISSSE